MKQTLIMLAVVLSFTTASIAEIRAWTLNSGKTIEAEFMSVMGGKISLKTLKGKLIKVPSSEISPEDLVHIELMQPPKLDFSFSKKTTQFTYAPLTEWFETANIPPRSQYYSFSTQIKQTSANPYNHELTAEVFVMAVEVDGGQYILIDRQKETFVLNAENKGIATVQGAQDLMITSYVGAEDIWRGEEYGGYLVVVTDRRGKVIAQKATRDWWFDVVDNLRILPVSKTFDKEGKRTWPTRPKVPDY